MDEEVVLLEEQLAAAQTDIERLQERLGEAEAKIASRDQDATDLRRQLDAARSALAANESARAGQALEIESLRSVADSASQRQAADAARYRELVLVHEPALPADLVEGATIEAVEEAVARARQTVARVRQHLEQQAQAMRVPTGAPARVEPDTSDLSAAEKIRFGLRQA